MAEQELARMNAEPDRIFDEYLVVLAQGGSRDAMDQLARRWTPRLVRYVSRTLGSSQSARDVVQETWIGAIRGLPRLLDSSQFPGWIYSIAHRKCVDAVRSAQRSRRLNERAQQESRVATPPDDARATDSGGLSAAIARLSEEQRAVVHLFYGEDLSVNEIASVLSVPAGTVKSRLFHAREILKQHSGE
jgi:RNA polymerase sigma-70 factor (ECF subfamily)